MRRLHTDSLAQLPNSVELPNYQRETIAAGIVHLGIGAFHRAHQAYYTEKVLNQSGGDGRKGDWRIIAASLRSAGVRDQLEPQQGLYTLIEKSGEQQRCQVMGAIERVLVAPEDPQALITTMADAAIKVISLTVTEKGYCHNPASGEIDWQHADLLHDLAHYREAPRTAIGYLAAALRLRGAARRPVTLLSCDNLPSNGRLLARVLKAFVKRVDPELLAWIDASVSFPCSMVDRIVPAVTETELQTNAALLGLEDNALVVTEPFCQWVIEDAFATQVPDWKSAGALIVADVEPFEELKLRLLNGSHSIIAYLGYLAGYDYVHQVMADPLFAALVSRYMAETSPALSLPEGFDVAAYQVQLVERFKNAALNHLTAQIAQDGSQKIPQRWLATLRTRLAEGEDINILALAIAGWFRYLHLVRDSGERFNISDPLGERLVALAASNERTSMVSRLLGVKEVFADLGQSSPRLLEAIEHWHQCIEHEGVRATLEQLLTAQSEAPLTNT